MSEVSSEASVCKTADLQSDELHAACQTCVHNEQRDVQQPVEANCIAANKQLMSSTGVAHRHGRLSRPGSNSDDLSDTGKFSVLDLLAPVPS